MGEHYPGEEVRTHLGHREEQEPRHIGTAHVENFGLVSLQTGSRHKAGKLGRARLPRASVLFF